MTLDRVNAAISQISYTSANNELESYLLKPLEQWGLLEVQRQQKKYWQVLLRVRKTPLLDHFVRYE